MKKKISILFAIFAVIFCLAASATFFSDVIVTSPTGIWTDSRAYTTLNAAITAIGTSEQDLYIAKEEVVTTLVIPANIRLHFVKGGSIANSNTLTINTKNIHADHQIFTGVGAVNFASSTEVRSRWFVDFETAITQTSNDTVVLIVDTAGTLLNSAAVGNNILLRWNASNLITIAAGQTLSNIGDISAPDIRLFIVSGAVTFKTPSPLAAVRACWFGTSLATLDIADNAAVAAEKQLIITPGDWVIDDSITLASNVSVLQNADLQIATTKTLTINGSLDAGLYQIFSCTGTGKVVFDAGAVNEVYPIWWATNSIPGTTDMTAAIQAAFIAGVGKNTNLADQTYYISATLYLDGHRTSMSNGILTTDKNTEMIRNTSGQNFNTIKDVTFACTYTPIAQAGYSKFHIRLKNTVQVLIERCIFVSGLADTDYDPLNRGGIWLEQDGANSELNRINECWLPRGSIYIQGPDSSITNCWVWGYTNAYAIRADSSCSILNNPGIIGSRLYGAIYLPNATATVKIIGNYIGGAAWDALAVPIPNNGYGIYGNVTGAIISGNAFHECDKEAIYIYSDIGGFGNTITGNHFNNGNSNPEDGDFPGTPDITLFGLTTIPNHNTISNNTFIRPALVGGSTEYAIELAGSGAATMPYNNTFTGNTFYDGGARYTSPAIHYTAIAPGATGFALNRLSGNQGCSTHLMYGTFTPVLKGNTSGATPATLSGAEGFYSYQADSRVFFEIVITSTAIAAAGVTGDLYITGLPFLCGNPQGVGFTVSDVSGVTFAANYLSVSACITYTSSSVLLRKNGTAGVAHAGLTVGECANVSLFIITGSYIGYN
jgi:hypothetical protein